MSRVTLELPDELLAEFESLEDVSAKVRQVLVLDLLRDARISQGQAARLLGVTHWDLLDLMVQYGVPSGPESTEELRQDIVTARLACAGREAMPAVSDSSPLILYANIDRLDSLQSVALNAYQFAMHVHFRHIDEHTVLASPPRGHQAR